MSLPRYQRYKDSGVEWFGAIPAQWDVVRLKDIAQIVMGQSPSSESYNQEGFGAPFLQGNADFGSVNPSPRSYSDSATKTAIYDDVLFSVRAPVGAINMSDQTYGIGRGLCAIRAGHEAAPKFLRYMMEMCKTELLSVATGSTYEAVSVEQVASVRCLRPALAEQSAIATFLDRETGKIDALIAEQEKLLALLAEKRQATISRAVTKGLNPDAPMKDSGVAWLGEVPAHWEIRSIAKATTKITNGYVGPTRDILIADGIPYIQATHIKGGRINFGQDYFVSEEWSNAHAKSILGDGDVLIVQTGAGTGDVGLVSSGESGFNCHALIILSSDKSILHGPYLAAILQSAYGRAKLASIQTGAMHPHLNCGEVKFVEIPLPPVSEQIEIMDFLMSVTNRFDALTAEASRAIALLKERRSALTGR